MNLNIYEFLTYENMILLAILSCGFYTGYTDFRYGKISNIYALFLISFGLISQIFFISEGKITLIHSVIILFGGLGLSFVIFYIGIWAAGDAKLFWGISLLIPPNVFSPTPETHFYPLILLVNIFILFLVYVTLLSALKMPFQQQRTLMFKNFREQLKQFPHRILQVLSYIGVGGLAFYIPSRQEVELDLAIQMVLFIVIVFGFNKVIKNYIPRKYELTFRIPFVIFAIVLAIPSLTQLGYLMVFISMISWFLLTFNSFVRLLFMKETQIEDLRPKMIPAERVVKIEQQGMVGKYIKVDVGFANPVQDNIIVDISSEGLTHEQIDQLRKLAADGNLNEFGNSLLVQEKIPFAFMIVIGALVTLLAEGMVHSFLHKGELSRVLESVWLFFS